MSTVKDLHELKIEDVAVRMVKIPAGTFLMGSPPDEPGRYVDETQRLTVISEDFWMSTTPCTQQLWAAVMGSNPSRNIGPKLPVERVSWYDCQEFCKKLNGLFPNLNFRLPTEAEWEYACRAGTNTAFNDGSACIDLASYKTTLNPLGWFEGNSGGSTHPVGLKKPNAWGLHDMHGGVWEWCQDEYIDVVRVLRGGSWFNNASYCRSAIRNRNLPGNRYVFSGFRFAIDVN